MPSFDVVNPATGQRVASYPGHDAAEVVARVERAQQAFLAYRNTRFDERASWLRRTAGLLRQRAGEYGLLMTREMGKPIAAAQAEVEKCAGVCEYYAEHGARLLASEPIASDARDSYVAYRPLGVVLAVMPWNFPFWQVFRFAAPALMAGDGALLKHASNVPGSALAIEAVLRDAGFPEHLFQTLLIGSADVAHVLDRREVVAATLTGSTAAGRSVARLCGERLKKTVLELGGSDPYVVLEDADLELAARVCAQSRLINSGQSCIAAKRFVVVEAVYEAFVSRFRDALAAARMGDPEDPATELGPQARHDLRDELHAQVSKSLALGARALLGAAPTDGPGAYYPASLLVDVRPGMPAYDDELFGPVASVIRARDEADALRIANDTSFGLGAAVFTRDEQRGRRLAELHLEAGSCFVNAMVRSDPRLPFGGIGESGYGRELGPHGIREFVNTKTVYVAKT
jgi:succinate-semialdehyde dehydrogenase / glutarate-semialdehyde dehydrogenase